MGPPAEPFIILTLALVTLGLITVGAAVALCGYGVYKLYRRAKRSKEGDK